MSALADFKRRASRDRAGLREIYTEAEHVLSAVEHVRLAEHLEQLIPRHTLDRSGHRRRVEPPFRRRPADKRRQALALLAAGYPESGIPTLLELPPSTWSRYRRQFAELTPKTGVTNGLDKRSNRSKRSTPVGGVESGCQALRTAPSAADVFGVEIPTGPKINDWIIDQGIGEFCGKLIAAGWDYGSIVNLIAAASRGSWHPSAELLEAHVEREVRPS